MWEAFLAESFAAWMLPASEQHAMSAEVAQQFLSVLAGRDGVLAELRATSALVAMHEQLRAFVRLLREWVRSLSGQCVPVRVESTGALRGRLDVTATLRRRTSGDRSSLVLSARERRFDRPEDELVCAVARRAERLLRACNAALPHREDVVWNASFADDLATLDHTLRWTRAREIPEAKITQRHVDAARLARGTVYRSAVDLFGELRARLDDDRPATIARVVAEGALVPLDRERRFELSVALRLVQALEATLVRGADPQWTWERSLVVRSDRKKRPPIARFHHASGARLEVFFDQSVLRGTLRDSTARHYLDANPWRPDCTLLATRADGASRGFVVECKLTENRGYMSRGFGEAVGYFHEYRDQLFDTMGAALVIAAGKLGALRPDDAVFVSAWAQWPPTPLVNAVARWVLADRHARCDDDRDRAR